MVTGILGRGATQGDFIFFFGCLSLKHFFCWVAALSGAHGQVRRRSEVQEGWQFKGQVPIEGSVFFFLGSVLYYLSPIFEGWSLVMACFWSYVPRRSVWILGELYVYSIHIHILLLLLLFLLLLLLLLLLLYIRWCIYIVACRVRVSSL